jgi:acylglycerol lipase
LIKSLFLFGRSGEQAGAALRLARAFAGMSVSYSAFAGTRPNQREVGAMLIARLGLRLLLVGWIATMAACAHTGHHVRYHLGPPLCKEGPPVWSASDGRQIMYRVWGPSHGEPRAVVVAVPGWNATAGDIEPLARFLAARGISVYSCGVRGQHGDLTAKSQHTKGDIVDGRLWTRDFCEFTQWVRTQYPRTPLFLYGQSMGALTVLTAASTPAIEHGGELRGVILHSPAVAMVYTPQPVRSFIGLMRALNGDRLLFNVGLIPGDKPALTSDPKFDLVWGLSRDRVRPGFTWRFLDEALKLGERARVAAASLKVPVLVLTGDQDPIGTAGVGQRAFSALMKSIPSSDKQRVRFSDGYHDLIHDKNKDKALDSIGAWMERELAINKGA